MEHDEMLLKLQETADRSIRNEGRIKRIENEQNILRELVTSVSNMDYRQGMMENEIKEIKTDVKTIANKPQKRWEAIGVPLPVEPATNKCGVLAKSKLIISPMASLPIAVNKGGVAYVIVPTNVSFKETGLLTIFGISTPIYSEPGIGANTFTFSALKAIIKSWLILLN